MIPRSSDWVLIWKGRTDNGALAAQMLAEHGLDVREQSGLETRLYVHEADEGTAQDLFRDWEL